MNSSTFILPEELPTSFEEERDDLLARYEGSPAFRPAGDYTPEQFEGRHRTYFHKLTDLLDRYAQAYPHLRDALGLELSRPRRPKPGQTSTAYEFDGLLLPERLARRVGRLKLPDGTRLFVALDAAQSNYQGPVARQQRYHFVRALAVAGELARSTTRDLLTTPAVVSALQRLRAFGPVDNQLQDTILGNRHSPSLNGWWVNCGLNADRVELRSATRSDHVAAYEAYGHTQVMPLDYAQASELMRKALHAAQKGNCGGFSEKFYAKYIACAAVPVPYHEATARICMSVTALYSLSENLLTSSEKKALLRVIQQLCADHAPGGDSAAAYFFKELQIQLPPSGAASRLDRHVNLSKLAVTREVKTPGKVLDFYMAIGEYLDLEEGDDVHQAMVMLAHISESGQRLAGANAEFGVCVEPLCLAFYQRLNFQLPSDQLTLQQLYPILLPCLDEEEVEVMEDILLDQSSADDQLAKLWLTGPQLLAKRLRERLRQRLRTPVLEVTGVDYRHYQRLLLAPFIPSERWENDQLFAQRYDVRYFMGMCQ